MNFESRGWVCLIAAFFTASSSGASYDLIIRNGRLVDGTGNPAIHADIAVKDGRISAVGRLEAGAAREIDAHGMAVAPGFIDVHTHSENIEELPLAENFIRMGVTTLVLGNCGGSKLEVGDFFRKLEAKQIAPNVATLIGHNTVRTKVMGGSFMRPPTEDEMNRMRALVEQGMKDGAVGLATGLIYLPGTFAKTGEIIELAKVASKYDGIYTSHMRNEGDGIFQSLDELFRIAREANIRAEISHIKLTGQSAWGQTDRVLAAIESARAGGLDITQDQYVYTASSTSINTLVPSEFREGGLKQFQNRLADPELKAKIVGAMRESVERRGSGDYSYAVIASCRADKSLNGLNVAEAAKKRRGSGSLEDQIETILEIEKNGGASAVFHGMSEADLQQFARHPNTLFASDSGVRAFGEDVPHPRGYGNNARVLARYVRELHVLRLEEAIRRMTSLPAATFRLKDRGQLREGAWADLVIFEPDKVQDNATFNDPHHYATGFAHVFVNGVEVVENDKTTGARPGQCLRHTSRFGKGGD